MSYQNSMANLFPKPQNPIHSTLHINEPFLSDWELLRGGSRSPVSLKYNDFKIPSALWKLFHQYRKYKRGGPNQYESNVGDKILTYKWRWLSLIQEPWNSSAHSEWTCQRRGNYASTQVQRQGGICQMYKWTQTDYIRYTPLLLKNYDSIIPT